MAARMPIIENQLPRLRRYGTALLGSKMLADQSIMLALRNLPFSRRSKISCDDTALFQDFHAALPAEPKTCLQLGDFADRDRKLIHAAHKLGVLERSLLLLSSVEGFDRGSIGAILELGMFDVPRRLAHARAQLNAALRNRLCIIVEDDLIALHDLRAEVTADGLCVAAVAKNQTEAYGLLNRLKPDIGIIDLALPEGATAGADVAQHLRDRFATKIIFITAFAKTAKQIADPGDSIVGKPWSTLSIKHAIAAVA